MYNTVIKICDTDEINSHLLKSFLSRNGYTTINSYSTPAELMESFSDKPEYNNTNQIVILAICAKCSDLDGIQATKIIKKDYRDVVVVCISDTGDIYSRDAFKVFKSGCDSWIDKNDKDYINSLMNNIKHWTQYLIEKSRLAELYNSFLSQETGSSD